MEGMAHFCEHVTFKGTSRRKAFQILNCLERRGGDLNAFTNKEDTVYYAAVLKDDIARAVDLLTDIVFHSTYPQKEIDKEVEVICDEIESYNDSPAELIYDEFENLIFAHHPLGHNILGTQDRVRSFTTADALRFTGRHYRPENAIFFLYGDVSFDRLLRLLSRATADQPAAAPLLEPDAAVTDKPSRGGIGDVIVMEKQTHQAHVMTGCRAFSARDDRRMTLYLLNNILGGPAMNARLNVSLRERHGLVYTVESYMTCYGDTGLWGIYFGCDPTDVDQCLRLIRRELDQFIDKPLTARQLAAAKTEIKGQIGIACDNRENFALDFGKSFLHYGWERDIDSLFQSIDAITAEQLQQVAAGLMAPENLTTLIFR